MKPKVIKAWAVVDAQGEYYCERSTRKLAREERGWFAEFWPDRAPFRVHKCSIRILPNRKAR